MKNIFFLLIFFLMINCSSDTVYWCGDHKCKNKKEKESYFKKTMIVEIRHLDKNKKKKVSEFKKITELNKNEQKKMTKSERQLKKEKKLLDKKRKKEEKKLAKILRKEEKKRSKMEKKLLKKNKNKSKTINLKATTNEFSEIVEKITSDNTLKPYPDINDIPN